PHTFSGNPGFRTGPPIKTFGGDGKKCAPMKCRLFRRGTARRALLISIAATLLLALAVWAPPVSAAETSLDGLKADLRVTKIMRVKIVFFPYLMETYVALDPEMLENYARNGGVVYLRPFGESIRKSLLAALDKIQIREKLPDHPDLRWGAIFYDTAD